MTAIGLPSNVAAQSLVGELRDAFVPREVKRFTL